MREERQTIRIDGNWNTSPDPSGVVLPGSRIVLIVHGYDVDDAGKSYDDFYSELGALLYKPQLNYVWEVYWPGYWPVKPHKIEPFSALSYPQQVKKAPHVGQALANHLLALDGLREVLFIAHSLGCRIVLETLEHLRLHDRPLVPGICLMAAAIPTSMVEGRDVVEDHRHLKAAAEYAKKHYILYSPADRILFWFFRPGQFAAGERWSQAVGRYGNPEETWRNDAHNIVNTGLDHSDYYCGRRKGTISPSVTAPTLARMFGRASPLYPSERDPYVVKWEEPSSPPLRNHTLPERSSIA